MSAKSSLGLVPPDLRRLRWGGVEAPAVAYLASVRASSRPSLVSALRAAALAWGAVDAVGRPRPELVNWSALQRSDLLRLRAVLEAKGSAPATAGRILAAVRGVLREAYRAGLIGRAELDRLVDVRPVRGSRLPPGRHVERAELAKLLRCAQGLAGIRDVAIVALLWGCGLRRAELAGLTLADVQDGGQALRIDGKGGKERLAYLPPTCAQALARWLAVRGSEPGALICATVRAKGRERRASPAVAVGPQAIYLRILALGRCAGVVLRPHDLRRTYIGDLLDAGVDLATVQASVGHSSPATTARYDRRGARAARDAAGRLALPGVQDLDS